MPLNSHVLKGRYEIQKHLGKRPGQQTLLALSEWFELPISREK